MRLRQAVIAAGELEPAVELLQRELGLGEPYRDPNVAEFGLCNAVFALGDCFLEVVAPLRAGTAAGRFLERGGEGGYMAIFDLRDLESARARAQALGVRTVWRLDLPDISGTHLHPRDIGGAIVSLDSSRPYGSWRWAGPDWTARLGTPAAGALCGVVVSVAEPEKVARRWGEVLGAQLAEHAGAPLLGLEQSWVRFDRAAPGAPERISAIALRAPVPSADRELLGVTLLTPPQAAVPAGT